MIRSIVYRFLFIFAFITNVCQCQHSDNNVLRVASFMGPGDGYSTYNFAYHKGLEYFYNTNKEDITYELEYTNENPNHLNDEVIKNKNYDAVVGHLNVLKVPHSYFYNRPIITSVNKVFDIERNAYVNLYAFGSSFKEEGKALAHHIPSDHKKILVIRSFDNYYDPLVSSFLDNVGTKEITRVKLDDTPIYGEFVRLMDEKAFDAYVLLVSPQEYFLLGSAFAKIKSKVPIYTLSYTQKYSQPLNDYTSDLFPIYYQIFSDPTLNENTLLTNIKEENWYLDLEESDKKVINEHFSFFIDGYRAFEMLHKAATYEGTFNKNQESLHRNLKLCFSEISLQNELRKQ